MLKELSDLLVKTAAKSRSEIVIVRPPRVTFCDGALAETGGAVGQGGGLIGGGCESPHALPTIAGQGNLPVMFVKSRIPKRGVQDGS